jgi:hypothetical protein
VGAKRKSKTQLVKQERTMQNTIALLNCLKRITPQQLMKTQVFTKFFSAQRMQGQLCYKRKLLIKKI